MAIGWAQVKMFCDGKRFHDSLLECTEYFCGLSSKAWKHFATHPNYPVIFVFAPPCETSAFLPSPQVLQKYFTVRLFHPWP